MSTADMTAPAAHATVEAAVRAQMSKALGGKRGIVEAAVPTIAFTGTWMATQDLKTSLIVGIASAVALLVVRIAQRTTPQFVLNSLVGIGIGAFFAARTGDAKDVFLPGILYNGAYAAGMLLSIVVRWPIVGFLIGSVTGDPTAWHNEPALVRLCARLTWLLMLPCLLRVVVQLPLYLADHVTALGVSKIVLGWPLQVAGLAAMVWVLARGRTPIEPPAQPSV
ncbi:MULTISPECIES: DUF3159 domain-containing protein [Microbispora]|uniref:DUF3159 domain-containing protein n=3 Tax=Microbispora TaxID=2005 RepID=A0ABY3LYV4_9ACTN|nr:MULTISPECIES: DUF3159 domain-containing protein [Microbispora]RGA06133.1 DUF3159 domain-containing protein [Microbispora triticiradicis]TLP63695.1 DUF3159 domain-containing protein [Microbispora fusca]TYB60384.1 DUF3159 domain-containing protein [Microbispora tritici]GLW20501.1 hypothetical protein Mame01_05440 [Microbispora amethystogenes]